MTEIDSDETGAKGVNPFTKTYFYQSGKTFMSNTITNATVIETRLFSTNSRLDDDEDSEEMNGMEDQIEQIQESQGEEDEDDEQNDIRDYQTSIQYGKLPIMSQFAKQYLDTDQNNMSFTQNFADNSYVIQNQTLFGNSSINNRHQSSDISNSFNNYLQEDELKESTTYRTRITENDNMISTYRNENQGLLTKDNNRSYILNQTNLHDQTSHRDMNDYSKIDLSDNQLLHSNKKQNNSQEYIEKVHDNYDNDNNFNDMSFAPDDEQAYQRKTEEDVRQKSKSSIRHNFQTNSSKKSSSSYVNLKNQFSTPAIRSKEEFRQIQSMKSSRSNFSGNSKVSLSSLKTKDKKKKVSTLFRRVLKQVRNTMFWLKKLKQQSFFLDEDDREIAELKVDGVIIKDETESNMNMSASNKKSKYEVSISNLNDGLEDDIPSPKKQINSSKSLSRKKTHINGINSANLSPQKSFGKKKKQSGGGSSTQNQSAQQNYNVKKKIVKSVKNKKPTLSFQLIRLFWIISFFCISFVTVFSFFFNRNNYSEFIQNIREQRLIIEVVENSVQIISNREFQILSIDIEDSIYPFTKKPSSEQLSKSLQNSIDSLENIKDDLQVIVDRPTSQNLKQIKSKQGNNKYKCQVSIIL